MNKYNNAKIYTVRSPHTEKYFTGSTCLPLSKKLYMHRKNITSYELVRLGETYIELLENYPCKSNDELKKRLGKHLRKNKHEIVNYKINECLTEIERKIYKLQYRINNITDNLRMSSDNESEHIKIIKNHLVDLQEELDELLLHNNQ